MIAIDQSSHVFWGSPESPNGSPPISAGFSGRLRATGRRRIIGTKSKLALSIAAHECLQQMTLVANRDLSIAVSVTFVQTAIFLSRLSQAFGNS